MGGEDIVISSGLVVTPESVSSRRFASAFRGYHPVEVRQFLERVADEMAAVAGREMELRRALQEALNRAAHPELDEATVTNVLGEHAARLIATARDTAAAIIDDAQAQADAVLRDAESRVERMREEADGLLARRVAEAEAAAAGVARAAEAEMKAVDGRARAEAQAIVDAATKQGREMVAEARDVRERMLGDLSRRRRAAQMQVEQLRAVRDRLLSAYDVVRRTVEEGTSELTVAEPESLLAAEAAALRAETADLALPLRSGAEHRAGRRAFAPPAAAASAPSAPPGHEAPAPTPARALVGGPDERRAPPPDRPPPDRPPLRPQTVADAVGRPDPRPSPAAPGPVGASSELATQQTQAVVVDAPRASAVVDAARASEVVAGATLNGDGGRHDGNGTAHGEEGPGAAVGAAGARTKVDELFASIRAERAHAEVEAEEQPQPPAGGPEPAATEPYPVTAAEPPAAEPVTAPAGGPAVDPVTGENALAERDHLLDDVEAGLTRALKRVLQDEQNEMLDRLRRMGPSTAEGVLPDVGGQKAGYAEAALPWLRQASRAGAALPSDPPPEDGHALRDMADRLADELVEPLRERLSRALEGAAGVADASDAAEALRAAYRQWKVQHVQDTARHHAVVAFGAGAFAATADGTVLQWLVDDDGHCPDCDDNALAGPTVKGQAFPTGQLHPPAHPGCRCLVVPAS